MWLNCKKNNCCPQTCNTPKQDAQNAPNKNHKKNFRTDGFGSIIYFDIRIYVPNVRTKIMSDVCRMVVA